MTTIQKFTVLDPRIQELLQRAILVRERAYCPYSKFPVGAALLTTTNRIYTGCNVENASFTVGVCAERVAFTKAISEGEDPHQFNAVAVVAYQKTAFTTPCGACRQFMSEFNENLEIYVAKPQLDDVLVTNMSLLLPSSFQSNDDNQI